MSTRNYLPAYNALHTDGHLASQCEMFLLTKAVPDIQAEDANTANHAARLAWANAVEQDPAALAKAVRRLLIKCVQNSTIATAAATANGADDSDVEFVGLGYVSTLVTLGA
jgi:hypothetical protein